MITVNLIKLKRLEKRYRDRIRADKSIVAFYHLSADMDKLAAELRQEKEAHNGIRL